MITAQEIMTELHVDETTEETIVFENLIQQASAIIRGSISFSSVLTDERIMQIDADVYTRLITTLVDSIYRDRSMEKGYSKGVQIQLGQLKNRVVFEMGDELNGV